MRFAGASVKAIRGILVFAAFLGLASYSFFAAYESRLSWFDAKPVLAAAAKYDATIIRDKYGVPHVSGPRDADAAFGLAYAHAEDNFATIERALLAARGRLAAVDGIRAAEGDYLVQLLGIWDAIAARYETDLSPATRALLEGYATGLNLYAAQHRGEVLPGFAPAQPQDIVALFMLRLPFFYGLDEQLRAILAGSSGKLPARNDSPARALAIAVAPQRSADGATRLLVNPQGPFTGALSWYEARVTSGEGWNMAGGVIPGAPVMLAGAGPNLGWGFSANHPDLLDVYQLEGNPNDRYFYRYDEEWRRLAVEDARIAVRFFGPIRFTFRREVLRSEQGPVIRNESGLYAVRYAGENDLRGVEAFYRLNRARDYAGFSDVLASGAIPSLDFVYADRGGQIAGIYNGAFPERAEGHDWTQAVAGNVSSNVWKASLPFSAVPKVVAPGSSFIVSADATPFRTTADPFNLKPESFAPSMGIETGMTNRARRALQLLTADRSITADEFKSYKFDACYTPDSDFAVLVKDLGGRNFAGDPLLEEAGEMLRRYNLCTNKENRTAALAVITATPILNARKAGETPPDSVVVLRNASNLLLSKFKRLDPTWGEVNRLRRGTYDLPIGGGPDALRDIQLAPRIAGDGTSTATAGDSLTFVSAWLRNGTWQVESVVPYGAASSVLSAHYSDQAPLFAEQKLKALPLNQAALMAEATRTLKPKPPPPKTKPVLAQRDDSP